jgi:hypothetical protein
MDFNRTVKLRYGVRHGDALHTDVTVGPLTADAEMRALLIQPGGIDGDLINRYAISMLSEAKRKELDVTNDNPPTGDDLHRARALWSARQIHQVAFRVVAFGMIPAQDIPAAVGRLLSDDLASVLKIAREVDDAVEKFRGEDAPDLAKDAPAKPKRRPDSDLAFDDAE